MTDHIYTLETQIDQLLSDEHNNSHEICKKLYAYQNALLESCGNNTNSKEYKKAIKAFRDKRSISDSYLRKKVQIGAVLIRTANSKDCENMSIDAIYKKYCAPSTSTYPYQSSSEKVPGTSQ